MINQILHLCDVSSLYKLQDLPLECLALLYRKTDDPMIFTVFRVIILLIFLGCLDSGSSISPFLRSLSTIFGASNLEYEYSFFSKSRSMDLLLLDDAIDSPSSNHLP